jgi:glycosyltransferase involved in cell wall biosynthesis
VPVTVVIPAYNRAAVIERAIRSARRQLPAPPAEIIVVDDCSTDDTADRAERAGAQVIRHRLNKGPGGARNTAIGEARHPWIAFLDSDDVWLPGHLAAAMHAADAGHVLVSAPGLTLPSDLGGARLVGNGRGKPVRLDSPLACLRPENMVATSGTVVSTDTARSAGGFPAGHRSEDMDLWIRILEQGPGLALAAPGYVYSPEDAHMSSDAAGMREAALTYVAAYRDRAWFDAGAVERMEAQHRWDDLRAALASRNRDLARRHFAWIAVHPRAALAIAELVRYRRGARKAGQQAVGHLSADVLDLLG